jgi:hypothetical protein
MLTLAPDLGLQNVVYQLLLTSIPPSDFYLRGSINVPYGTQPFPFFFYTTTWDKPLKIVVNGTKQFSGSPMTYGTVRRTRTAPNGFYLQVPVGLRLRPGKNLIEVACGDETTQLEVVATRLNAMLWVMARNILNNLVLPIDAEGVATLSPWSSHTVESLFKYTPLLADERVARTHSLRKTVMGSFVRPLSDAGVRDFLTGLVYSNPIIQPITANDFGSLTYNLERDALLAAGNDFHVWVPNRNLATWLAFAQLVSNLKHVFTVDRINPGEVVIREPARGMRWPGTQALIAESHIFHWDFLGPNLSGLLKDIPRIDFAVHVTAGVRRPVGFYRWTYPLDQRVRWPLGVRRLIGRRCCDGTHTLPRDDGVDYVAPFLPARWRAPTPPLVWAPTAWALAVATVPLAPPLAGPGWRSFPLTSRRFAHRYQTDRSTTIPTLTAQPLNTMSGYYRPLPPPPVLTFPLAPLVTQAVQLTVDLPGFPAGYYRWDGATWLAFIPRYVWLQDFLDELATYGLDPCPGGTLPAYLIRREHVAYFADLLVLPPPLLGDLRKVEYDGRDYWWNGTRWGAVRYEAHPQVGGAQLRDVVEVRMDHLALYPPCTPTTFGSATRGSFTYGAVCVSLFSTYFSTTAGSGSTFGG